VRAVEDVVVVLITAPDEAVADTIAAALVEARVCACVNVVPGVRSVYRWQGAVERATEVQLLAKTTRDRLDDVMASALRLHPYGVPEVLALPTVGGLPAYLQWVVDETR
jgi:periplasmic divalent cation tolerance protein